MAPWPSGKAKVCNTSTPSPNLGGASKTKEHPKGCSFVLKPLRPFGLAPCNLLHGIQFAFLTKQRLPLASNLVGKNSAHKGSIWVALQRCPVFFAVTSLIWTRLREQSEAESSSQIDDVTFCACFQILIYWGVLIVNLR